jgi:hypothetical protein
MRHEEYFIFLKRSTDNRKTSFLRHSLEHEKASFLMSLTHLANKKNWSQYEATRVWCKNKLNMAHGGNVVN